MRDRTTVIGAGVYPWLDIVGAGAYPHVQIVDNLSLPEVMEELEPDVIAGAMPVSLDFMIDDEKQLTAKLCVADRCVEARCDFAPVLDVLAERFLAYHRALHGEGDARVGAVDQSFYMKRMQQAGYIAVWNAGTANAGKAVPPQYLNAGYASQFHWEKPVGRGRMAAAQAADPFGIHADVLKAQREAQRAAQLAAAQAALAAAAAPVPMPQYGAGWGVPAPMYAPPPSYGYDPSQAYGGDPSGGYYDPPQAYGGDPSGGYYDPYGGGY